ncbi:MAG: CopG family ribbon-helix-helix protein [Blastocatellia bacterium]
MRTTVRLPDDLMQKVKVRAAEEQRTLTDIIEEALNVYLFKSKVRLAGRPRLPISKASGGILPGVDLNRSGDLENLMDR